MLSKDHTILERRFMEFPPFGVDERGEKILDSSGVVVRANVQYLEEYIARKKGAGAGAGIAQTLCDLLNERIRDSVYHVSPELLRNEWNSYSYEFVAYLRELCKQLSGEPRFHQEMAANCIIPPVIQVLGRPFSLRQIFQMYPHFGQKYAKGVVEFGVGEVTDRSAVLRQRFTERGLRQFGPYVKACALNVCDQVKGGMCALPEKIHGLPRATVTDRLCIVQGDEWCEWEFSWERQPPVRWLGRVQKWFAPSGGVGG